MSLTTNIIEKELLIDQALTSYTLSLKYPNYESLIKTLKKKLLVSDAFIRPFNGSRNTVKINLICTPKTRSLPLPVIRHYLGTSAIRYSLQAPVDEWELITYQKNIQLNKNIFYPDAIWHKGNQNIAIEWDTSRHSKEEVIKKASFYRENYHSQVWGAANLVHAASLSDWVKEMNSTVIYVPWHNPPISYCEV